MLNPGELSDRAFEKVFLNNPKYAAILDDFKGQRAAEVLNEIIRRVFALGLRNGFDLGSLSSDAAMREIERARRTGTKLTSADKMASQIVQAFLDQLDPDSLNLI